MAQRTHPPLGIFIQDRTGFPFGARLRVALLFIFRSRFPMPVSAFGRQKKAGRPAGRSADCSVHFPPHCRLVFLGVPFHLRFFFRTRTGHGCFMPLERSVTFSTNVWDWYEHSEKHFFNTVILTYHNSQSCVKPLAASFFRCCPWQRLSCLWRTSYTGISGKDI